MTDPRRFPETTDDAGRGPDRSPSTDTKRWVVVGVIIIVIALLGLIVFLHLNGVIGPGAH